MDVQQLRCQRDRELEEQLLKEAVVRRAVEEEEKAGNQGARHRLLATAVRVSPEMSQTLDAVARRCVEVLGLSDELEMYVYPEALFNAACIKSDGQRVFVLLSSGLVECFDPAELRFVVGHELGHHIFGHHRIPIRALLENELGTPGPLALQLFAWSRYAEISADRVGIACADELDAAARALFQVASGLRSGVLEIRADDLLAQIRDLRQELSQETREQELRRTDWFATHPFSPIRLRAAQSFVESGLFREGGKPRGELEREVVEAMSLMEPSYIVEKSDQAEAMRRVLLAGGVLVADATDGISPEEIAALEGFFGEGSYSGKISADALREDLPRRLDFLKRVVPQARRAQVIRDLCLVALADGHADRAERDVILEIARDIGVSTTFVDQTLATRSALD